MEKKIGKGTRLELSSAFKAKVVLVAMVGDKRLEVSHQ
jgi:hypothetical protein